MSFPIQIAELTTTVSAAGSACLRQAMLVCCCLLAGCATPLSAYREFAYQQGWQESLVSSSRFAHRIWFKPGLDSQPLGVNPKPVVHVYIEGDGRAWESASTPSTDPTSRSAMMFSLMALDPAPAIYIGRPCYLQTQDARCDARWWTYLRYSDDVVSSLAEVITGQVGNTELTLIGHSGGGALAVLLAARLDNVSAVVTLAGNLDVAAWTKQHGYMPLTGSLDPALQAPLPPAISQWHFSAAQDEVIAPAAVAFFCSRQQARHLQCDIVPGTRHTTGWSPWWQKFVKQLVAAGH